MFKKRIIVASAVAMLGLSSLVVPVASAQAQGGAVVAQNPDLDFGVDMTEVIPADTQGVVRDGGNDNQIPLEEETPVAGLPKYKTYEYEGETFLMELRPRNPFGDKTNTTSDGETVWGYYIVTKNGDRSDECRIDLLSRAVNDPSLIDSSRNGFLYSLGQSGGAANPNTQYLHNSVQHWGGTWRFPFAFAEAMYNVKFDVNMPTDWGVPKLSDGALYTTGSQGPKAYPTRSGGMMDVSEFLTVQPYDSAANDAKAAKEKADGKGEYPNQRVHHSPDNWVDPTIIDTADPYHKQVAVAYAPEGSRFVVQWEQAKTGAAANAVTDSTIHLTADTCYTEGIVQQGSETTIPSPGSNDGEPTLEFQSAPTTPEWVEVKSDGVLVARPGFGIPTGIYKFPVLAGTSDTGFREYQASITVTPAFFVDGYDDAYTGPGSETVIFPQALRSIPEDAKFALGNIPGGWTARIDENTGKLTVTPPTDAAPGRTQIPVTVTYTAADGTTKTDNLTAGVQVDRRVTQFEVNEDGQLVVTYNDGTTQNIGSVVGPQGEQGATGESVRIKETGTDSNGNTTITFVTVDSDGSEVAGSDQTITVSKGDKGDQGDPGTSIEVTDSTVNENGQTVVEFSDGSTVVIPAPQSITITGTSTDPVTGDIIITFSDGEKITIPAGRDGRDGADGKSLTIVGQTVDSQTGVTTITFSDGNKVELEPVKAPRIVDQKVVTGDNGQSVLELTYDNGDVVRIPFPADGQSVAILEQRTHEDGSVEIVFSDGSTVKVDAPAAPTIVSQEKNADGDLVVTWSNGQTITVPQGPAGQDGADGQDGRDGSPGDSSQSSEDASSDVPATCIPAGLSVGLPLLLLIPVGLAAQVSIPGLTPMVSQISGEIANFNSRIQQQLGVFDGNQAGFASQFNAIAGQTGQVGGAVIGGAVILALGLLAADYLATNCSPEGEGFLSS
ncbi:Rib/alpha-like domain-containing protein [Corynebacterium sp. LK2510]|uniref:Rib/alpha-like domain-containing protein n=1 Tax=Corynebacterium sp. LK2510 TaxID=3110472 RepID=UPI0034CF7746